MTWKEGFIYRNIFEAPAVEELDIVVRLQGFQNDGSRRFSRRRRRHHFGHGYLCTNVKVLQTERKNYRKSEKVRVRGRFTIWSEGKSEAKP